MDDLEASATDGDGDVIKVLASGHSDEDSDEDDGLLLFPVSLKFRSPRSSKDETEIVYAHHNEALKWRYLFEVPRARQQLEASLQKVGATISKEESVGLPHIEATKVDTIYAKWKKEIRKEINKEAGQVEVKEIAMTPGTYKAVTEMASLRSKALESMQVTSLGGKKKLWIMGQTEDIETFGAIVQTAVAYASDFVCDGHQGPCYQKHSRTSSDIELDLARALKLGQFYPGVSITISAETSEIKTEGPAHLAHTAITFIDKLLGCMQENTTTLTEDLRILLQRPETKASLQMPGPYCHWTLVGNRLSVYALSASTAKAASNAILDFTSRKIDFKHQRNNELERQYREAKQKLEEMEAQMSNMKKENAELKRKLGEAERLQNDLQRDRDKKNANVGKRADGGTNSGRWIGYYTQFGHECPFTLTMKMQANTITGDGIDGIGSFLIDGTRSRTGEVNFTKRYHGKHSVEYTGKLTPEGTSMSGVYKVGTATGNFSMTLQQ